MTLIFFMLPISMKVGRNVPSMSLYTSRYLLKSNLPVDMYGV